MLSPDRALPGSFRDPAGVVFEREGVIYRQVNQVCRDDYDSLLGSGLYDELVAAGYLVPHEDVAVAPLDRDLAYKVIRPDRIPFISYPCEWCYSQLKSAAQLTLEVQKRALDHGMSLKDASAYNVQFRLGKPVLIDTLSFERHVEGRPWAAYRQFCQHFLAPLALMSRTDVRLGQLARIYHDGVPLDLASALLPLSTHLQPALLTHVHLHARFQARAPGKATHQGKMGRTALLGVLEHLEGAVSGLRWEPRGTPWADYYSATNYTREGLEHKKELVARFLDDVNPRSVWDLGGNLGLFARLASDRGIPTICFDMDPAAVERNYLQVVENREAQLLPLVLDLANPTPGLGWMNHERSSLIERGPADTVFALALVHHLAISNNLPFARIAEFFATLGRYLIVEFVPRHDSQVQTLLALRPYAFQDYDQERFESAMSRGFDVLRQVPIRHSERTLYLMRLRD